MNRLGPSWMLHMAVATALVISGCIQTTDTTSPNDVPSSQDEPETAVPPVPRVEANWSHAYLLDFPVGSIVHVGHSGTDAPILNVSIRSNDTLLGFLEPETGYWVATSNGSVRIKFTTPAMPWDWGNPDSKSIRPGTQYSMTAIHHTCTVSVLLRDGTGERFFGTTAGHCVSDREIGAPVYFEIDGKWELLATLIAWDEDSPETSSGADWGLFEFLPNATSHLHPERIGLGGPTGLFDANQLVVNETRACHNTRADMVDSQTSDERHNYCTVYKGRVASDDLRFDGWNSMGGDSGLGHYDKETGKAIGIHSSGGPHMRVTSMCHAIEDFEQFGLPMKVLRGNYDEPSPEEIAFEFPSNVPRPNPLVSHAPITDCPGAVMNRDQL